MQLKIANKSLHPWMPYFVHLKFNGFSSGRCAWAKRPRQLALIYDIVSLDKLGLKESGDWAPFKCNPAKPVSQFAHLGIVNDECMGM